VNTTLEDYPHITKLWHPSRNGDHQPADFDWKSAKRVWFMCNGCPSCGEVHEWDDTVSHLIKVVKDFVCPCCTFRPPAFCSCRSVATNAWLVSEWHESNPRPEMVYLGNGTKQKWRCSDPSCGNVWKATPSNRGRGTNCPKCVLTRQRLRKNAGRVVGQADTVSEWYQAGNGPATNVPAGGQ
jgi:hypothetical protein